MFEARRRNALLEAFRLQCGNDALAEIAGDLVVACCKEDRWQNSQMINPSRHRQTSRSISRRQAARSRRAGCLKNWSFPTTSESIDLRRGIQKSAQFRAINPMGKVPALRDGNVKVAENPAICIYLADRYSYGDLAPALDHPLRGDYLRWMVFSTAVFEPAIYRRPRVSGRRQRPRLGGSCDGHPSSGRCVVPRRLAAGRSLQRSRCHAWFAALGRVVQQPHSCAVAGSRGLRKTPGRAARLQARGRRNVARQQQAAVRSGAGAADAVILPLTNP